MSETVEDLGGVGGSVHIKGTQGFTSDTDIDHVTRTGERFLRRGSVDTNIANFDTSIWNKFGVVTTGLELNYPMASDNTHAKAANYSTVSEQVLFIGLDGSHPCVISKDGGVNYQYTTNLPAQADYNKNVSPYHSAGNWVVAQKSSSNVMVTQDSGDSWLSVNTGLNGSIYGIVGDEIAIVVWSTTGYARRSIDGGLTWSDVTSLTGSNVFASPIVTNNYWFIIQSSNIYRSSDNGATWDYVGGALPSGVTAFFTDGISIFAPAHYQDKPVDLWKSIDGETWSDSGVSLDESGDTFALGFSVNDKRVKIGEQWIHASGGFVSKDGLNWKDWSLKSARTFQDLTLTLTKNGAALLEKSGGIYSLEYLQYAGDIEFSWVSANEKYKWVRVS